MSRPDPRWAAAGVVAAAGAVLWLAQREARPPQHCAPGMVALAWRCCGEGQRLERGRCAGEPERCADGMVVTPAGCVPRSERVILPGGTVERTPTDWDAPPTTAITVASFAIDRHEVTEHDYRACVDAGACGQASSRGEPGLPQVDVTALQAAACCRFRGGALPTSDQLAFAAMGSGGRRYPWGNAGAVCRRAAFALLDGPCARGGDGPQLAGSHPDGSSPEGIVDLAGNAAEWTAPVGGRAQVRGGSWRDATATSLRSFSAVELPADHHDATIGFRCVYPVDR